MVENNLDRELRVFHPTLHWVAETTDAIVGVLENQGPAGVHSVRHYADCLQQAADDAEAHGTVDEQYMRELASALLDVVQRRKVEKQRRG
jgi:hypothetical protein